MKPDRDVLDISQLHDKRLDAVSLSLDDQLRENRTVSRGRSSTYRSEICQHPAAKQSLRKVLTSDPPLGRAQMRRMNNKLVRLLVECGGGLDTRDVGTVCEF
jgi:hypothetical protein